jgi:hypothetical protein
MSMAFLKSKTPPSTRMGEDIKGGPETWVPAAFGSFGRSKELVAETVDLIILLSFNLLMNINRP